MNDRGVSLRVDTLDASRGRISEASGGPRCRNCRSPLADDPESGLPTRCPNCGRWLTLPRNEYFEALSEMPSLGGLLEEARGVPWRQLSPSIAFVVAVCVTFAGISIPVWLMAVAGVVIIPLTVVAATLLEFAANQAAARAAGDPMAMGMLAQSSDWEATRVGRGGQSR